MRVEARPPAVGAAVPVSVAFSARDLGDSVLEYVASTRYVADQRRPGDVTP
jgi:hypothetical protein